MFTSFFFRKKRRVVGKLGEIGKALNLLKDSIGNDKRRVRISSLDAAMLMPQAIYLSILFAVELYSAKIVAALRT